MNESRRYLLGKYPRLREIWPEAMVKKLTFLDHRYNWATVSHPEADRSRQELEDALKWASSNGFLSDDLEGRLRGADKAQFHSAKDELLVGKFLTRVGQVKPAYVLPSRRVGDWLIDGDPSIYVEVKSICDVDDEANRTEAQLRQAAGTVESGRDLEITVTKPGSLSSRVFRAYLEKSLAGLATKISGEVDLPDYVDPSGLTISVTCLPVPNDGPTRLVITSGGRGPITSHRQVQKRARRGASQLPEPNRAVPSMVVICRHSDLPDTGLESLGAMFSLPSVNVQTGEWYVQSAGISQPDQHTRVSAIAQYSERLEKLEVVHNPFAKNPIEPERFSAPGVRQLVPDGPGRMLWIGE